MGTPEMSAGVMGMAKRRADYVSYMLRLWRASDGEEALLFLRHQDRFAKAPRPDLVLLDMQMPKMDGREVLSEIRADSDLERIPVVVMTASLVHKAILEGENLRVDAYMTKPVSFEQFLDVVRLLRRSLLAEVILPELD